MLEVHFNASDKKFKEYLLVCERLGKQPDPNKMPMDSGRFPYEVQLAFLIYDLLPDRWEGMSGSYLGKEWGAIGALLDAYNIEERQIIVFFIKAIDIINSKVINKRLDKDRKKRDKKSQAKQNFPKGK